ncbi:MAG: type III-B CRISPR module RAMP protein Cmr1 [Cyanobacteria bacterium CRU_2_1]|nr:type III-B CRISPR module RAMP protein Cmr1 [Cyanobacteria bacterium CRU_2_1]
MNIKTLTPLWTGGVEAGKCDRIHETGILGSLRWWMEVLVRGMGGNSCDPTEQKCSSKNGLCEVCKIFGAEGQKRRFRLEVVQDNTNPDRDVSSKVELQSYQYQYKNKQGKEQTGTRTPTWYFPQEIKDKPRAGIFTIQIQSLDPKFKPEVIGGLVQFIADWSALGARSQMGFGVIQVEESRIDTQTLYDWLMTTSGSNICSDLPSLQNIFLAQIQPKDANSSFKEKDTFNLKYDLRQLFRTEGDTTQQQSQGNKPIPKKEKEISGDKRRQEEELRHFIMGTVEDDRQAAKIKISRSYNDNKLMRVWGWVPTEAEVYKNGWNREKIVDAIYQHLKALYTLHGWREMNSERDTVTANQTDVQVFLRSLLQLQEDE